MSCPTRKSSKKLPALVLVMLVAREVASATWWFTYLDRPRQKRMATRMTTR
jgi:hypothetical protein